MALALEFFKNTLLLSSAPTGLQQPMCLWGWHTKQTTPLLTGKTHWTRYELPAYGISWLMALGYFLGIYMGIVFKIKALTWTAEEKFGHH